MAMHLPKGSIMSFSNMNSPNNKIYLSEHNREPLQFSPQRIETKARMANGRMRSWFVADKGGWSTSWSNLPHNSSKTVDGRAGGEEMEEFYYSNPGEFLMQIRLPDGTESEHIVMFTDFTKSITKRGVYEFWDIEFSVEEV